MVDGSYITFSLFIDAWEKPAIMWYLMKVKASMTQLLKGDPNKVATQKQTKTQGENIDLLLCSHTKNYN